MTVNADFLGSLFSPGPKRYLLVAMKSSIRRISLDTDDFSDVILGVIDVHNVIALDVDIADDKLYHSDVFLDVIRSPSLISCLCVTLLSFYSASFNGARLACDELN